MALKTNLLDYIHNVMPLSVNDYLELIKAFTLRLFTPGTGLSKSIIVRTRDGYLFFCRPHSPDLYTVCCHETYELKKWFTPLVKGDIFIDVGAYIGTYTIRGCERFREVIAIEPLPFNFAVLKVNVHLNQCDEKTILINKAIGSVRRITNMYVPVSKSHISYTRASLAYDLIKHMNAINIPVIEEPLDDILKPLNIDKIDFMKIDIEGYVTQALPGMMNSLERTRYLFIEIPEKVLKRVHMELRRIGFKLIDVHGNNYLYFNKRLI